MKTISDLIKAAKKAWDRLTPEEQRRHLASQRYRMILSEMALGSDADEAAVNQALMANDSYELAYLETKAKARWESCAARLKKSEPERWAFAFPNGDPVYEKGA